MKRNIFEVTFYNDAKNKNSIAFKLTIYEIDDFEAIEKIHKISNATHTYWGDMKWIGKEE
jgi:hypothetical protein